MDLRIGSDEEKGLTKAVDSVFPGATWLLCTKHLKDNVADHLKNNLGTKDTERTDIINKIIGPCGIAKADDTFEFDQKTKEIVADHQKFTNCFVWRLKDRLKDYVNKPCVNLT